MKITKIKIQSIKKNYKQCNKNCKIKINEQNTYTVENLQLQVQNKRWEEKKELQRITKV